MTGVVYLNFRVLSNPAVSVSHHVFLLIRSQDKISEGFYSKGRVCTKNNIGVKCTFSTLTSI